MAQSGDRHLSAPLLLGLIVLPSLFCWLLLRRGYSWSLRRSAFFYAAVLTVAGYFGRPS